MTQYKQTFLQIIHMFPFVRFLHIAEEADQTFSSSYIKQNESVTELVFVCVVSILVSQLNILQEELSILGSNCGTSNLSWRVAMTWSKLDPRIDSPPPPSSLPCPSPTPVFLRRQQTMEFVTDTLSLTFRKSGSNGCDSSLRCCVCVTFLEP